MMWPVRAFYWLFLALHLRLSIQDLSVISSLSKQEYDLIEASLSYVQIAMDSLNNIDFKKLASQQKSIQMKMRLLALAHFKEGHSHHKSAEPVSTNGFIPFIEEGLAELQEKPRTVRPAFLTPEQKEQLRQYRKDKAHHPQGGRLTGASIHAYIAQQFDKHYHTDSIY
ncbi:helix-turn-helix domain-containing protein [Photobacterium sp. 1_MG-2023]|uniref:helix-turn-helix domain-containing protein n=1 Tax=Photobacterium sp. 1_MG-2023 TaxID=3062646 RepID=UPI0026E45CA8|nr:helix-turn-helix domain-containing protein [Photobacterium sp. 1_MG-2023]MDO6708988.1 helix-turn-helix domain-containing protein [Photobacterium sp. 1_MG-2023]